jgi:hypothetical protein
MKLKRTTLVLLLGACLAAAGCGSDDEGDPIPTDSAALLQEQLDNIQARIDNGSVGACDDILSGPRGPNVDPVNQAIAQLPDGVDQDVRSALQDGFDRLFSLVEERCTELRAEAEAQQEEEPAEEPPVVTETETVPPPETETEVVPPPETDTETTPPPETGEEPPTDVPAPEDGGEGEDGGGNGGVLAPQGDQG